MNIEDLPVYAYFQLEDFGWEDVKELPGADEECLCDFEIMANGLVEDHFRNACKNLWPIISESYFKGISLGIDLLDMSGVMASYYHDYSKADTGSYGFSLSYDVLKEYLKARFDGSHVLSPLMKYMWEHEVIHMGDHKTITEFRFNLRSTDIRELFIHFLLSYRNEGIAELWYSLKGNSHFREPADARQKFLEDFSRFDAAPWEDLSMLRNNEWEIMHTYGFYSAGPWMILHVLTCTENKEMSALASSAIGKMMNGEIMEDNEIIDIIKEALKVSNDDFVKGIVKHGFESKPFIEQELIYKTASRIAKIDHPREIHEQDEEYNRVSSDLISFFKRNWEI